ncbi:hypothetical protein [Pedobacter sp. SYSU D00535]|uniref:hypothetical protein n=1 Tax=Pedobacter sp. SYSU D00535 TaxID=2810308 RepID=UPI001A96EBD2|nr:hypothetical protein [Pedobacter sp. SYSU D00535]
MQILALVIIAISAFLGQTPSLKQVRQQYYQAVTSEEVADRLHSELKQQKLTDPVLLAYFGATQSVRAKHAINPYNKVSFLKSGLRTLQTAVSRSPENLEIRFLRFSLEHYLPSFLGMSKNLTADRKKMVDLIKRREFGAIDATLLKNIISFMKETKRCTAEELAVLNRAISNG